MRKLVLFVWTVYDIPHCYDDDYGQPYHVSIPRQVLDRFVIYVAPSCYAKCLSALTLGSLVVYTHNIPFRSLPSPRYLSPCYVSVHFFKLLLPCPSSLLEPFVNQN